MFKNKCDEKSKKEIIKMEKTRYKHLNSEVYKKPDSDF